MMAPQGIGAAVVMRLAGSLSDKHGPRYVAACGMAGLALGTFFYTTWARTPVTTSWDLRCSSAGSVLALA